MIKPEYRVGDRVPEDEEWKDIPNRKDPNKPPNYQKSNITGKLRWVGRELIMEESVFRIKGNTEIEFINKSEMEKYLGLSRGVIYKRMKANPCSIYYMYGEYDSKEEEDVCTTE